MKIQQIMVYALLILSLLLNSVSTVQELHNNRATIAIDSIDDYFISIVASLALAGICLVFMNLTSRRKVLSKFYFKENSVDWMMRVVSYVFILYTFFISNFLTFLFHLLENTETENLKYLQPDIIMASLASIIIWAFTVLLMFSISIRTKEKNEVQ